MRDDMLEATVKYDYVGLLVNKIRQLTLEE